MANTKSAEKRIKINERNRLQNRFYKSSVKTKMKKFFINLELYKKETTPENKKNLQQILSSIYCLLDKATKKKIFHRNLTARKKSKLSNYIKSV